MKIKVAHIKFLLSWLGFNFLGLILGVFFISDEIPSLSWLLFGVCIGFMQCIKLVELKIRPLLWVLATALGCCIPATFLSWYYENQFVHYFSYDRDGWFGICGALIIAMIVGIAQAAVMGNMMPKKRMWVFANLLGVVICLTLTLGIFWALLSPLPPEPPTPGRIMDEFILVVGIIISPFVGCASAIPTGIVLLKYGKHQIGEDSGESTKVIILNRQLKVRIALILSAVVIIILGLYVTWVINAGREPTQQILDEYEEYTINPDTLLESLHAGDTDVFLPYDESTSGEIPPTPYDPVEWEQEDYFLIAEALHQLMWGESLENWEPNWISFDCDCHYIDSGAQEAWFKYLKVEEVHDKKSLFVSIIVIQPLRNQVWLVMKELSPVYGEEPIINLDEVEISMEEALMIAEKNGGYEFREEVKNDCHPSVEISPYFSDFYGWRVKYMSSVPDFAVHINSETGEVEWRIELDDE